MPRKKLYLLILGMCFAGIVWVGYSLWQEEHRHGEGGVELCLFRRVTTLPCPSCGSTRSVVSFFQGNVAASFKYNPIGFILIAIMLVCPPWIIFDLISGKETFRRAYLKMEEYLRKKPIALTLVILVFANWVWNFFKYFNT